MRNFLTSIKKTKLYRVLRDRLLGAYSIILMAIFRVMPIKKNKVFIVSYFGKGFGDNGKYIVEELRHRGKDIKIYWAVRKKYIKSIPKDVHPTKYFSLKYFYHLATSKVWINNARFSLGTIKRKKQFYIQTWHSSLRLKKIEEDAGRYLSDTYIKSAKRDSKMIDLIISGNGFSTNIFKKSFWYSGAIMECGVPRCDLFLNHEAIISAEKKIRKKYSIQNNKKIIIYAPTFRRSQDEASAYIDCDKVANRLGDKYAVLVRMHPSSKYHFPPSKNVIDVTSYNDMQELICASDFLVTDYSGCCFDMMIRGGACIICAKDLDEYLKKERDLYFDYKKDLPFPITESEDELVDKILNFNYDIYNKNVDKFNKKIGLCENGTASKTVCDIIMEKING